MKSSHFKKGVSLVEVIVGSAIIVSLVTVVSVYAYFVRTAVANTAKIQATFLVEEGLEAVRCIRDTSWTTNIASLTMGTTYYLSFNTSTNKWSLSTTASSIDSTFTRKVVFSTVDANTKKVVVSVSWSDHGVTNTNSASTYFTSVFGN